MTLRPLIAFCLCLILALTSQSMAVARGASAATGQVVLCTGSGLVAIYVDAEGAPTSAPHICPDAALNVVADLDPIAVVATDLEFAAIEWQTPETAQAWLVQHLRAMARAPPVWIG
jgi:hypothetical protein